MSKDGKTQRGDYLVVIKQVGGKWLLAAHAANAAMAPAAGHQH